MKQGSCRLVVLGYEARVQASYAEEPHDTSFLVSYDCLMIIGCFCSPVLSSDSDERFFIKAEVIKRKLSTRDQIISCVSLALFN